MIGWLLACVTDFPDEEGPSRSKCQCEVDADGDGEAALEHAGADCDDGDGAVGPHATETCDNGIDDDCDGVGCRLTTKQPADIVLERSSVLGGPLSLDDITGDGQADLVLKSGAGNSAIWILSGLPSAGDPKPQVQAEVAGGYIGRWTVGDVTADGQADLIAERSGRALVIAGPITSDPDVDSAPSLSGAEAPSVGDLDGDGHGDLAVFRGDGVYVLAAPITSDVDYTDAHVFVDRPLPGIRPAVGDLDGDGADDLWVEEGWFSGPLPSGALSMTDQDGRIEGLPLQVYIPGDVDGDGHVDLIGRIPDVGVGVFRGPLRSQSARFPDTRVDGVDVGANGFFGEHVAVGDLDGDGQQDLVVHAGAAVLVYYGPLPPRLDTHDVKLDVRDGPGLSDVEAIAAGDLDGDGLDEIAVGADVLEIWIGTGL